MVGPLCFYFLFLFYRSILEHRQLNHKKWCNVWTITRMASISNTQTHYILFFIAGYSIFWTYIFCFLFFAFPIFYDSYYSLALSKINEYEFKSNLSSINVVIPVCRSSYCDALSHATKLAIIFSLLLFVSFQYKKLFCSINCELGLNSASLAILFSVYNMNVHYILFLFYCFAFVCSLCWRLFYVIWIFDWVFRFIVVSH